MTSSSMTYHKREKPAASFVTAMFEDGAVSFNLLKSATLGDIAERLNDVAALHIGAPVAIDVTFNPVANGGVVRALSHHGLQEFHW